MCTYVLRGTLALGRYRGHIIYDWKTSLFRGRITQYSTRRLLLYVYTHTHRI